MKNFGKELRKARGKLSRSKAAKILGVSEGAVLKWERGERQPEPLSLPEIMRRLPMLCEQQPA